MKRSLLVVTSLAIFVGVFLAPATGDWYNGGSSGNVPDASPPERVDDDGSSPSEDSYDPDADARNEARWEAERQAEERRAARREEAARRTAARQEEARREAARREAARREAARQETARREAARQEAARVAAERQAAAARQRLEAESRRTGFGPHIRTVHVPLPSAAAMTFYRDAEIRSNRSPVITLSPGTSAVLGTIGLTLTEIPQKVGEVVLTYLGRRSGAVHTEEYLTILNINKGLADDAVSQLQTAVRLIGSNYPQPQTSEFLSSSSARGLRVLVSSLSTVPEHGMVLTPADEEELETSGRGYWRWASAN